MKQKFKAFNGKAVRKKRLALKLSHKKLSLELYTIGLEVTGAQIDKVERGQRKANCDLVSALAFYFDVSIDFFFEELKSEGVI